MSSYCFSQVWSNSTIFVDNISPGIVRNDNKLLLTYHDTIHHRLAYIDDKLIATLTDKIENTINKKGELSYNIQLNLSSLFA